MKIYIAGKITGLDYKEAIKAFFDAEILLRGLGHDPVNPVKHNGLDLAGANKPADGFTWADYMKADIPLLLGCDAIYLLSNWADSKGARLEKYIAEQLGMLTIFVDHEEILRRSGRRSSGSRNPLRPRACSTTLIFEEWKREGHRIFAQESTKEKANENNDEGRTVPAAA